tara:strand:- start:4641 stop:5666 length:1026 start_codon:yes stop_codon:yes gene_type:complete
MSKTALITGITGQDGAYLADFLLRKGYHVYGTFRRISSPNFSRLDFLDITDKVELIPFDLLDQSSIMYVLEYTKPDELYNLAAQSFVGASFEQPIATGEVTGLGLTRVLDTLRMQSPHTRFYQASSSEMFGGSNKPLNENSSFKPRSPYAAAKLYAHWVTSNYREAYDLFACSGILFNHESPLRGIEFVTRKITYHANLIKMGLSDKLSLGNIEAKRDWGFAGDYVEAMWLMLQQDKPEEYVIATGKTHTVKDFAEKTFKKLGLKLEDHLEIDKKLFRPTEVDVLIGDPSKAIKNLGWNPSKTSFDELINIMVQSDQELLSNSSKDSLSTDRIKEIPHFKE